MSESILRDKLFVVKKTKVCKSDNWPIVYIPKFAVENLGLKNGQPILLLFDPALRALLIKPIKEA